MVIPDDHYKKWFEVMGELRTKVEKVTGHYDVSKWIRQLYHVKPELRHLFVKEWERIDPMSYEQHENDEEVEEVEETSGVKTYECTEEKQISLEDKVKRLEEENKNLWKMIDNLYDRVDMVMQIARESRY